MAALVNEQNIWDKVEADYGARLDADIYLKKNEVEPLKQKIKSLLLEKNAKLVAHYYTSAFLQELADETGGIVSDSLEMARFGTRQQAQTLVVAGVRFMGETAKILNPDKRILMPRLDAECSLDLGCPVDEFTEFCDQHPEHTVVVYANTSAAVKARADWVVTSSIALKVVEYLKSQGKKILWAPDKHLGHYVQQQTQADMLLWNSSCVIHDAFKAEGIKELQQQYPDAAILVHPESPASVVELADVVGSTTALIKAVSELPNKRFIVATDKGIFHKMKENAPDKEFIEAASAGAGATCESCAHCPWMAMNSLQGVYSVLKHDSNEIRLDASVIKKAYVPLKRMIDFSAG